MAAIEPAFRPHPEARRIDPDTESFAARINVLLRARWMLLLWSVIGVMTALVVILASQREYTSRAVIMPQGRKSPSLLTGVASQLNLSVSTGDVSQSPAFYADLIESREILGDAVDTRYNYRDGDKPLSGTLIDVFESKGSTTPLRREAAIDELAKLVGANVVAKTGVIQVSATLPSPDLAKQVAQRLIDLLDQFNQERRKSQASAERQFTQQRLVEVTGELRQAEDGLQSFLQQNRTFTNSPELAFQRDRLNNDLTLRRELYASIAKAYEDVRLEEVRDTPVITIVEAPNSPVRPDPRGAVRKMILGLIGGLAFGVLLALVWSWTQERPAGEDPIAELQRLRWQALGELFHPIAALRRTRSHGRPAS